jgi:hypothetical protein
MTAEERRLLRGRFAVVLARASGELREKARSERARAMSDCAHPDDVADLHRTSILYEEDARLLHEAAVSIIGGRLPEFLIGIH